MDDKQFEERVRAVAHQLWEQDGRREGHAEAHWRRAVDIVAGEQDAGPAPATPAMTELAGETADTQRSARKASSSPRRAATASKTETPPPAQPTTAPAATKSKRAPKPAR